MLLPCPRFSAATLKRPRSSDIPWGNVWNFSGPISSTASSRQPKEVLKGACRWANLVWTNQYFLLGFDKLPMDIMLGSRFSRARDRAWKKPWKIRLWLMEALHGLCMSEVRVYLGACATWNEVQKKRPNDSTVGAHNLVNCWNWPFTSECPAFLGCVFFQRPWDENAERYRRFDPYETPANQ